MEEIEYTRPSVSGDNGEEYFHKFDFLVDGVDIGNAELFFKNSPFPFYYFSWIDIDEKMRGQGYGKRFLQAINKFLDSEGDAGILVNTVGKDKEARLMYAATGWREIDGYEGWYIYNAPESIESGRIVKAIYEIKEMME